MIDLANGWLQRNGHDWEVVNLETIILLYKYNDNTNSYEIRPNDCCFYIYGSEKNNVLKALRMWVRRRTRTRATTTTAPTCIGCRDMIPEAKGGEGGDCDVFENLDDLIGRFNVDMHATGLPGRIVTVESLAYEANNDWRIEPDLTLSALSHKNVFILRVFYEHHDDDNNGQVEQPMCHDQIEVKDFQPERTRKANFFRRPTFQTFDTVIERASDWLRKNSDRYKFINAQSIDIKMKSMTEVNTRQMTYTEHGNYMRVFRLALVRLPVTGTTDQEDKRPLFLATRLFLPASKTDTISILKQRLSDWINLYLERYRHQVSKSSYQDLTQAQLAFPDILSAETVEVFAKDVRNENARDIKKAANVDTFLANRFGNKNAYLFFSFRIFYDNGSMASSTSTMLTSAESVSTCTASEVDEEEEEEEVDADDDEDDVEDESAEVTTGTPGSGKIL